MIVTCISFIDVLGLFCCSITMILPFLCFFIRMVSLSVWAMSPEFVYDDVLSQTEWWATLSVNCWRSSPFDYVRLSRGTKAHLFEGLESSPLLCCGRCHVPLSLTAFSSCLLQLREPRHPSPAKGSRQANPHIPALWASDMPVIYFFFHTAGT